MSDLIEWLRARGQTVFDLRNGESKFVVDPDCQKAADEIERLTEANAALMAERASLIETKHEQIVRLTAELTATLAKLVQYEQGPVFYANARELAAARLGEGDEVWLQTKPYNYDDVQLIVRPEASHE